MPKSALGAVIGLSIAILAIYVVLKYFYDEQQWARGPRAFYVVGSNYYALSSRNSSSMLREKLAAGPFDSRAQCESSLSRWHSSGTFFYNCRELLVADVRNGALAKPSDRNLHESEIP